jgi:hypothetical protein
MWNVTIETGLPAEEALGQILDSVGVHARSAKKDDFLGQPFRSREFNQRLLEKRFGGLKKCEHPNANPVSSGIAAVCSTEISQFNRLVVWAGGGRNATEKEWFLRHAGAMLTDTPDFVHFTWDRLFPELCVH